MPFPVNLEGSKNLKQDVMNILNSTTIRITGRGPILDINAFLSTHSVQQAIENVNVVKNELFKSLPGGESNIKSIFIKSTNAPAVPIFLDLKNTINDVKLPNNMTPSKIRRSKKLLVKRLKKNKEKKSSSKKKLSTIKQKKV